MTERGFRVETADSGARALELAASQSYSIVVADLVMPQMDGDTLLQELRHQLPEAGLFLISGEFETELDQGSFSVPTLTKPWSDEALTVLFQDVNEVVSDGQIPTQPRQIRKPAACVETQLPQRVLLLEDQPSDLFLLRRYLGEIGMNSEHLFSAETLDQAYRLTQEQEFDVILADLDLPDADGTDSVEFLVHSARNAALVILSGVDDENIPARALGLGAHEYLSKLELSPASLRRAVRHAQERKLSEERLTRLAHQDPLTGLANRTTFGASLDHRLARARRHGTTFPLLVLDLDRFKPINDSLGHDIGDALLEQVAMRLKSVAPALSTIARLGGDEFAIIGCEAGDSIAVTSLCRDLLAAMKIPFLLGCHTISISCSIGAATYPQSGDNRRDLLRAADEAMYSSKRAGRGRFLHCSAAHSDEALSTFLTEQTIRKAVSDDSFRLMYQPQVDLRARGVAGFEALLRCSEGGEALSPTEFIPVLEETRLISEVGRRVIRLACHQLRRFRDSQLGDVRMAVNVSPIQLDDPDLVEFVDDCLRESELPASSLELELTESTLMRDVNHSGRVIAKLKRLGVRVALDDFGTGYSSLAYLHRLGIDTLKIDGSFVAALGQNTQGEPIAGAIISLGLRLGLEVVAEGVETREQANWLARQGCPVAQGFYFGRPSYDWGWDQLDVTRERISLAPRSYPPEQPRISRFPTCDV